MELSCKTATGKEYEIRFMGSSVIGVTSILYIEFIGSTMMEIVLLTRIGHILKSLYLTTQCIQLHRH
jgi:hypothetical protein